MIAYAITDPNELKKNNPLYLNNLARADWVLYRNKESLDYRSDAIDFLDKMKNRDSKLLLHQDYKLAASLGVWGVHLTATQARDISKAKALGLYTIISTHTQEEITIATQEGADAVTFSPIFATPNKGEPKGVELLKEVVATSKINIIALGGIVSLEQIDAVREAGAFAYASIRYFVNGI